MKYRCAQCHRLYDRDSNKVWIKSYCSKMNRMTRLILQTPGLSEESLEKAIVAIRAHIAEMGETTNPKPTKLLIQPGLLKQLGLTVEDVVKMIETDGQDD